MSEKYLPLFRKYRPQSFKDVVGQESLVKALSNAIELNKIANAYLFSGPRGTGKTSCARIFAKSLNCMEGPTLTPCQKCPSCLDITNASGLDVIEIDAATNRGIDDAKELIAKVQYAPMNGKYKIFIIDEVHMLSNEAFNALLKTFEEPPSNVIFILATTEPHKVIETIVSRCQRFDLRRITTDDITKRLREISDIEKIKITDDALYTIAKNVSGGLRDSLALLDQVSILGAKEEITKDVIENLLGKMTFDVCVNFLNKILSNNTKDALLYMDEIYNKGLEPKNFCENFIEFLRNLTFAISSNNDKDILKFTNFNSCDIEQIKALNIDTSKVFKILNKVIEYYKEIRLTTNPYLWVELLIINLCNEDGSQIQPAASQMAQSSAIKPVEPKVEAPVPLAQSVVKETLKEIEIPKEEIIKEAPKTDEPEHLLEYKEKLYDAPLELPKVPGVDDVKPKESLEVQDVSLPQNSSNEEENPAILWANVLNAVESVPAKFFFSGMGKLVGIKDKRITLGFINENVINQAKSDTKFKHLDKAVKNVLGADYSVNFILMTPDIKPIDVKLTAKIQTPQPARNFQNAPSNKPLNEVSRESSSEPSRVQNAETIPNASKDDIKNEMLADMLPPKEEPLVDSVKDDETKPKKPVPAIHYGKKTQEMLEAFNGKVIE